MLAAGDLLLVPLVPLASWPKDGIRVIRSSVETSPTTSPSEFAPSTTRNELGPALTKEARVRLAAIPFNWDCVSEGWARQHAEQRVGPVDASTPNPGVRGEFRSISQIVEESCFPNMAVYQGKWAKHLRCSLEMPGR